MHDILVKIAQHTKKRLILEKKDVSLEQLKKMVRHQQVETKDFNKALLKKPITFIAEVKFASPSEGVLGSADSLIQRIVAYEGAGADAISLVTEKEFFHGDPVYIATVKKHVKLPILQKDFVVDEYQIYKSKQYQADALLLIVRLLDRKKLQQFIHLCFELGIEPVVEISSDEDLEKIKGLLFRIVAVNARDLDTFEVSVEHACNLLEQIPNRFTKIGFSGIKSVKEVMQYKKAGALAVLVGTSLMKAKDAGGLIRQLKGVEIPTSG